MKLHRKWTQRNPTWKSYFWNILKNQSLRLQLTGNKNWVPYIDIGPKSFLYYYFKCQRKNRETLHKTSVCRILSQPGFCLNSAAPTTLLICLQYYRETRNIVCKRCFCYTITKLQFASLLAFLRTYFCIYPQAIRNIRILK